MGVAGTGVGGAAVRVILDSSSLIEYAHGSVYVGALLASVTETTGVLRVPVAALAQAWMQTHADNRYRLEYLAVATPVKLDSLDADNLFDVATVAADCQSDGLSLAHTIYLARLHREPVVTADPGVYQKRYPDVAVEALP
jgi:hypothetical protein